MFTGAFSSANTVSKLILREVCYTNAGTIHLTSEDIAFKNRQDPEFTAIRKCNAVKFLKMWPGHYILHLFLLN
jgi:hypothetical protein